MTIDGSCEKGISVAFEKLFITSSKQTSNQTKTNNEIAHPLQSLYFLQSLGLEKAQIMLTLKQLRKKSIKPVAQVLMIATLRSIYFSI